MRIKKGISVIVTVFNKEKFIEIQEAYEELEKRHQK